jgi:hypothetical protein
MAGPRELGPRTLGRANGKAERFIQNLINEWAYGRPFRSTDERSGDHG